MNKALLILLLFAFAAYGSQMPEEWLDKLAEQMKIENVIKAERERRWQEEYNAYMRPVKLGWRMTFGSSTTYEGSDSKWFDVYQGYDNMGEAQRVGYGEFFAVGLTLNIWPYDIVAFIMELNYNFFSSNYCYGGGFCMPYQYNKPEDYIIFVNIYNHTVSVPVLLRLGSRAGLYSEAGYQLGFPFYSNMHVKKGNKFSYEEYDNRINFSEFRREIDHTVALGFGVQIYNFNLGFRFFIPLTKLDKAGTLKSPFTYGFLFGGNIY